MSGSIRKLRLPKDKVQVAVDLLRETGFSEQRINLLLNIREEYIDSILLNYKRTIKDASSKKRRTQKIPHTLNQYRAEDWCESHGGHTNDGTFCFHCERCGLWGD